MIPCFPTPYPDELLYSVCARHTVRIGYNSGRSAVDALLGNTNAIAVPDLPSHLNHLIAALPPGHELTVNRLIDRCTLFPFYGPFLPPDRHRRVRDDMRGDAGMAIHRRSGIMASTVAAPVALRYCPACTAEDRARHGEAYWRRVHQAPGVEVCPTHEAWLERGTPRLDGLGNRHRFIAAERVLPVGVPRRLDAREPHRDDLLGLARDAGWLLCHAGDSPSPGDVFDRYRLLLGDRGYVTAGGRIRLAGLRGAISRRYGDLLARLGCPLDAGVVEDWLARLMRPAPVAHHPLRHLLLIRFVGRDVASFFASLEEAAHPPFGRGPWPCLSRAGGHFGELRIGHPRISHRRERDGRPLGVFTCPDCAFSYSRTGPDDSATDRLRIGRIRAFGAIWEGELRRLWRDPDVSLEELARRLGVDPRTAKRQADRLGLPFPPAGSRAERPERLAVVGNSSPTTAEITSRREAWRTLVCGRATEGTTALRAAAPALYVWLYRHDRQWLRQHSPAAVGQRHPARRVDWARRDEGFERAVVRAARRLARSPGRPRWITQTALARACGRAALIRSHRGLLPRAAAALRSLAETREAFALRRIEWAVGRYADEGIFPHAWELVARAGIARVAALPVISAAVESAIARLLGRTAVNVWDTGEVA